MIKFKYLPSLKMVYGILGQTRTWWMWVLPCIFNYLRGLGLGGSLLQATFTRVNWSVGSVISKTLPAQQHSVSWGFHGRKILHFVDLKAKKPAFKQEYSYINFNNEHLNDDINKLCSYVIYWVLLIYTLNQKSLTLYLLHSLNKAGMRFGDWFYIDPQPF